MGYKMDKCSAHRTVAITTILFVLLFPILRPQGACGAEDYAQRLDQAQRLLDQQNADAALALFKTLMAEQPSFSAFSGAARASAVGDQPENALGYYRQALELAKNNATERRICLFGIARMLMWLERYAEAERTYAELLSQPLSKEDHAAAAAGRIRSLSFQGKPMRAYRSVSPGGELSPAEQIELGRAALWAGWTDKAAEMLQQEIAVEPDTRMAKELEALRSGVQAEIATPVDLHGEFISDSDGMRIKKSELAAAKNVSAAGNLGLVFQHQGFEQRDQNLTMNSLQARYSSRLGDMFWLSLQAGPAAFGEWRTALWSGSLSYRPNDEIRYEAFALREAVETLIALNRHITLDTAGLAATYTPVSTISLAGSAFRQWFSDDNSRTGGTARIATPISKRIGLDVQVRARYFEDSRRDTVGYFNPDRFHEEKLLLAFDKRLGSDWRLFALAGPGFQNTTPGDGSSTTLLAEFSLKGRINKALSLSLDYGYSNSAIASSSGYRRQYSSISFFYPW